MKTILVPIDFSDATEAVVKEAAGVAQAWNAQLYLLHVAPPDPDFVGYDAGPQSVRDAVARRLHEEHRSLQDIDRRLQQQGLHVISLLVQGETVSKILKEAERIQADMIVIGSHGHSALRKLLVGSVAEGVLRGAAVPVLVVPASRARG